MSILSDNFDSIAEGVVLSDHVNNVKIWWHRYSNQIIYDADSPIYDRGYVEGPGGIYIPAERKYNTAVVPAYCLNIAGAEGVDSLSSGICSKLHYNKIPIEIHIAALRFNKRGQIHVVDPKYPVLILNCYGEVPGHMEIIATPNTRITFICFDDKISMEQLQSWCPYNEINVQRFILYKK